MKKKKGRGFILFLLGTLVGACLSIGAYFLTVGEVAWQEYIEAKIIPNIVLALTTIGSIYFTAKPLLKAVNIVLSKFTQATQDVNSTVENGKETQASLKKQDEKIEEFEERFDAMEELLKNGFKEIQTTASNTEQIIRIGFCNTQELVVNGYATEIAKVGKKDEEI